MKHYMIVIKADSIIKNKEHTYQVTNVTLDGDIHKAFELAAQLNSLLSRHTTLPTRVVTVKEVCDESKPNTK